MFSDKLAESEREKTGESLQESKEFSLGSRPGFWNKRKMGISWYIKLNIMVMGFLFVLFLIKQTNAPGFKAGLKRMFSVTGPPPRERSFRIKTNSENSSKKVIKR